MSVVLALAIFWVIFWVIWTVFALSTGHIKSRAKMVIVYLVILVSLPLIIIGIAQLKTQNNAVFWSNNIWIESLGFIVFFAGFSLAIWSRIRLGKSWSGRDKLVTDHKLVVDGPYKFIRHPIYTGFIFMVSGSFLAVADAAFLILLVATFAILFFKARREETILRQQYGPEYERYRKSVRMLIPFIY
jgi:protein-S-isoprenylcysteine O-methyltransferase Ste14